MDDAASSSSHAVEVAGSSSPLKISTDLLGVDIPKDGQFNDHVLSLGRNLIVAAAVKNALASMENALDIAPPTTNAEQTIAEEPPEDLHAMDSHVLLHAMPEERDERPAGSDAQSDSILSITPSNSPIPMSPMRPVLSPLRSGKVAAWQQESSASPAASPVSVPPPPRSSAGKAPVLTESPQEYVTRMMLTTSRKEWGAMLGGPGLFFDQARTHFVSRLNFRGMPLDMALRKFLLEMSLPRESQQIERMIKVFATHYERENPTLFPLEAETAESLAFALIMAHTFLFNRNARNGRPSAEYWVQSTAQSAKIPEAMALVMYENIRAAEFVLADDNAVVRGELVQPGTMQSDSGADAGELQPTGPRQASALSSTIARRGAASVSVYRMVMQGSAASVGTQLDHPTLRPRAFCGVSPLPTHRVDPVAALGVPGVAGWIFVPNKPAKLLRRRQTLTDTRHGQHSSPLRNLQKHVQVAITKRGAVRRVSDRRGVRDGEWYMLLTQTQLLLWNKVKWTEKMEWEPGASATQPHLVLSTLDCVCVVDRSTSVANAFRLVLNVPRVRERATTQGSPDGPATAAAIVGAAVGLDDNEEFLFQVHTEYEAWDWVTKINHAAAMRSCGVIMRSLPAVCGDEAMGNPSRPRSADQATAIPAMWRDFKAVPENLDEESDCSTKAAAIAADVPHVGDCEGHKLVDTATPPHTPHRPGTPQSERSAFAAGDFTRLSSEMSRPLTAPPTGWAAWLSGVLHLSPDSKGRPRRRSATPSSLTSSNTYLHDGASETGQEDASSIRPASGRRDKHMSIGIFTGTATQSYPLKNDLFGGSGRAFLLERKKAEFNLQRSNAEATRQQMQRRYDQLAILAPVSRSLFKKVAGLCEHLSVRLRALALELEMLRAYDAAIDAELVACQRLQDGPDLSTSQPPSPTCGKLLEMPVPTTPVLVQATLRIQPNSPLTGVKPVLGQSPRGLTAPDMPLIDMNTLNGRGSASFPIRPPIGTRGNGHSRTLSLGSAQSSAHANAGLPVAHSNAIATQARAAPSSSSPTVQQTQSQPLLQPLELTSSALPVTPANTIVHQQQGTLPIIDLLN